MNEGHIFVEGVIDHTLYEAVKKQVSLAADADALIVHIASPGGSVYDGYKIYHVLKSAGKRMRAIIEGEAQSMATFISLAADEIEIKDPSIYMIHNPSQGLQGDADALQGGAEELRIIEDEMSKAYSIKTGIPVEEIKKMMKKESRMNAFEAKQKGFVDRVTNQLKAVAIGTKQMEDKNAFDTIMDELKSITNKLAGTTEAADEEAPKAVEFPLKDGSVLVVDGEGDLMGMPATVNGEPAPDGEHELEDGRVVVTAGGVVTEVKEAAPVESPEQQLKRQVDELKAQLQKAEAEKNTLAANETKTKEEVKVAAQAVAKIEKELKELKNQTIGDGSKPDTGMNPTRKPIGLGESGPNAVALDLTKAFINEKMPWLKRHYDESFFSNTPSMASILETNFSYTYPGILTTDIFYKPTLTAPALSDIFTIDQDIKFKKQYNLVTQLDKIVKPFTGCGTAVNADIQNITNTEVVTKEFQMYEGWCKTDFTDQLSGIYNNLAQEWLKTGEAQFDPAGTPIDKVIMTVLKDSMQRDIFRRVSFAAGDSSDADYNQFDALWTRNIDSSGAANYCVRRAGSALGTAALSAGNALTYLGQAYAQSNILLKNRSDKKFFVTRSIWDNYYDSLIGNGSVTEQAFSNLQKGLTTLTYKGIPVIPVDLWDVFLAETDNPLNATVAHLVLLTVKDNHILGVENGADLNTIDSWYEKKDQKRYYRSSFKLGYNYLHCDLTTVMY